MDPSQESPGRLQYKLNTQMHAHRRTHTHTHARTDGTLVYNLSQQYFEKFAFFLVAIFSAVNEIIFTKNKACLQILHA